MRVKLIEPGYENSVYHAIWCANDYTRELFDFDYRLFRFFVRNKAILRALLER